MSVNIAKPKATVVIPTKGRPNLLRRSVSSAIKAGQMAGNVEIIVVNDGDEECLLDEIGEARASAVRVVRNSHQKGPSGARNCGVEQAAAPIIFFLDDDDAFICGYIRDTLRMLEGLERRVDFGFSSVVCRGNTSRGTRSSGLINGNSPIVDYLAPLSSGVWIRRDVFQLSGGLDPKLNINEDTEFFLRLAERGLTGWYSSDPGVVIRPLAPEQFRETASLTRGTSPGERAEALEYILSLRGQIIDKDPNLKRRFRARIVKYLARDGNVSGALSAGLRHQLDWWRILLEVSLGWLSRKSRHRTMPHARSRSLS